MNINSFLASKKLLEKDKKSLSRDASKKSLTNSIVSNKFKPKEQQPYSPTKINFKTRTSQLSELQFKPKSKFEQYTDQQQESSKLNQTYSKQTLSLYSPKKKSTNFNLFRANNDYEQDIENQQQQNYRSKGSLWADVTNADNNFNSSRLQSKQCLEMLTRKTLKQIDFIENMIQTYNRKIKFTLQTQYKRLKQTVLSTVQKIFDEYQENLRKTIDKEIKMINREIYQNKSELENIYNHLQKLKQGIESPNWRKVAAQILSSQIQQQIEQIIMKTNRNSNMVNISLQPDRKSVQAFQEALDNVVRFRIMQA